MPQPERVNEESRQADDVAGKLFVMPDREPPATTVKVRVESDGPATLKFVITAA